MYKKVMEQVSKKRSEVYRTFDGPIEPPTEIEGRLDQATYDAIFEAFHGVDEASP